jgi:hypothetical protein
MRHLPRGAQRHAFLRRTPKTSAACAVDAQASISCPRRARQVGGRAALTSSMRAVSVRPRTAHRHGQAAETAVDVAGLPRRWSAGCREHASLGRLQWPPALHSYLSNALVAGVLGAGLAVIGAAAGSDVGAVSRRV